MAIDRTTGTKKVAWAGGSQSWVGGAGAKVARIAKPVATPNPSTVPAGGKQRWVNKYSTIPKKSHAKPPKKGVD